MRIAFAIPDPAHVEAAGIDLHRLLLTARTRGHACRVYSAAAEPAPVDGVAWRELPAKSRGAHRQHADFVEQLAQMLAREPADAVLGFGPLPGVDVVLLTDMPMAERPVAGWIARRGGASRYFRGCEEALFGKAGPSHLLFLSPGQQSRYRQHYSLDSARTTVLPPGVEPELPGTEAREQRRKCREQLAAREGELLLLFAGSDFQSQGLERSIRALAHAREAQPHQAMRLLVAGDQRYRSYQHLARKLGVGDAVEFLRGEYALAQLLLAVDTLLHPALPEASGAVLLRALVAGLPVITTQESGYAAHIAAARGGLVLRSPFQQEDLDEALLRCIDGIYRSLCRETGQTYARLSDLYSLPETCIATLEKWAKVAPGLGAPRDR